MKRRDFLKTTLASTLATMNFPLFSRADGSAAARPVNVLYVVSHDLGRFLGTYGSGIATPQLDAFGAGGVIFTNAHCSSPACSPSRGCVMTGMYAHNNGLMGIAPTGPAGWHLPETNITQVDLFNAAGYETINVGGQHERATTAHMRYQVIRDESNNCDWVFKNAIELLKERRDRKRPFYMNVFTGEIHASKCMPGGPASRTGDYPMVRPEDVVLPATLPDLPEVREVYAHCNAAVKFLDQEFGKFFRSVQEMGFEDDTLIIFTTDHGLDGLRGKGTIYDAGTQIALMVRGAGVKPTPRRVSPLIQNIDLLPTLCEATGISIPPSVQGRSFWPLLAGGRYQPHEHIFTERNYHGSPKPGKYQLHYDPARSVRTERFHYVRNFAEKPNHIWYASEITGVRDIPLDRIAHINPLFPPFDHERPREELFDLVNDPNEKKNLADDPAYADDKAALVSLMNQWMEETKDPLLDGPIPPDFAPWPDGLWNDKQKES